MSTADHDASFCCGAGEGFVQAAYDLIVDHPMWIDGQGLGLDYSPERERRIGDFLEALLPLVRSYGDNRAAAAIAALSPSPSPAEEAVRRRLELARIEGRAESLNAEVHEMEDDDDAQLLAVRAIQWEQEAAVLRAALASPAPAPQGEAPTDCGCGVRGCVWGHGA